MGFTQDLTDKINSSLKAGDKLRTSTLRLFLSAVKNKEIELKRPLTEAEAHQVVATLIRQRRDSIEQYNKGGRPELAEKEEAEIEILKGFLPPQLSEADIVELVKKAASETGAVGMKDMGKVMKEVMPKLKGRADGNIVNAIVRRVLGG